jgi:hypothetical protein
MKQATIRSVCECQSKLEAILDENRHVLVGFAIGTDNERELAPAHSIEAASKRFDVGWLCNICGRNTLRSFDADGLVWRDAAPPVVAEVVPAVPRAPSPTAPVAAAAPPVAAAAPATPVSAAPPPNAATAVALKSLTTPSKPPTVPPKPASTPPGPPKTS